MLLPLRAGERFSGSGGRFFVRFEAEFVLLFFAVVGVLGFGEAPRSWPPASDQRETKASTADIVPEIVRRGCFCQSNLGVGFMRHAIDCGKNEDILRACQLVIFVLLLRRFFGLYR